MFWLYLPVYILMVIQSFYPIFMLVAMLFRQSRLFYSIFHKVDKSSQKHGGELVAEVIKSHGVESIFTLPGENVSPIIVASSKLGLRPIDVRHESTDVFITDASPRVTGISAVAVVTAGLGLTHFITATKLAQMAKLPIVIIFVAAATMLNDRESFQDIDQMSLLKTVTKKCYTVDCVRDIAPILREAFRVSQVGSPGPVFVELPVDILHPYSIISDQFKSMSVNRSKQSLFSKVIQMYSDFRLNYIFADAWKKQDFDPLPISLVQCN